jgi:hypothetical protein
MLKHLIVGDQDSTCALCEPARSFETSILALLCWIQATRLDDDLRSDPSPSYQTRQNFRYLSFWVRERPTCLLLPSKRPSFLAIAPVSQLLPLVAAKKLFAGNLSKLRRRSTRWSCQLSAVLSWSSLFRKKLFYVEVQRLGDGYGPWHARSRHGVPNVELQHRTLQDRILVSGPDGLAGSAPAAGHCSLPGSLVVHLPWWYVANINSLWLRPWLSDREIDYVRRYAFYAFYAWWFHFPQSRALASPVVAALIDDSLTESELWDSWYLNFKSCDRH